MLCSEPLFVVQILREDLNQAPDWLPILMRKVHAKQQSCLHEQLVPCDNGEGRHDVWMKLHLSETLFDVVRVHSYVR